MSIDRAKMPALCTVTNDAALESPLEKTEYENATQPSAVCSSCSGTGWEFVVNKGVRPCHCRAEQRRANLLADACIPKLYSESTLQTYQPLKGNLSQLRAF